MEGRLKKKKTMIKEAYVSYEIAKLLKEKGFDEPCFAYYEDDGNFRQSWSNHAIQNKTNPCFFGNAAPTHQMACAWLREKGYHIYTFMQKDNVWVYEVQSLNEDWAFSLGGFKEHNDAIEAALKYTLKNLI